MAKSLLGILLFLRASLASEDIETIHQVPLNDPNVVPCSSNAVVAAWCDSAINDVECMIDQARDIYMCQCPNEHASCPEECIEVSDSLDNSQEPVKTRHSILCHGVPQDEPNYILKNHATLPVHHCENNALVANWCNEATSSDVNCLLLGALDEYICTCYSNAASCPTDCIQGSKLGRKTKHAVRCRGIPMDTPNYVLE